MPGKGISKKVQDWRYLVDQTRPLLTEAPHLAAEHAELEGIVQEVEKLLARAEIGNAERLEANRLRKENLVRGTEARARLAAALQHHLGTQSERLLVYGVTPRPRTIKRLSKAEKELAAIREREKEEKEEEGVGGAG
jgi:hypothetical protein